MTKRRKRVTPAISLNAACGPGYDIKLPKHLKTRKTPMMPTRRVAFTGKWVVECADHSSQCSITVQASFGSFARVCHHCKKIISPTEHCAVSLLPMAALNRQPLCYPVGIRVNTKPITRIYTVDERGVTVQMPRVYQERT